MGKERGVGSLRGNDGGKVGCTAAVKVERRLSQLKRASYIDIVNILRLVA